VFITGSDSVMVGLQPLRWQFPPDVGDWDDQWLVIGGTVDMGDRSWSFSAPCLLISEARELAGWLRAAADGRIVCDPSAIVEQAPSLGFMEPTLGFSLAARHDDELTMSTHFTAEAAPPWLRGAGRQRVRHVVALQVPPDRLLVAADDWTRQINDLAPRPWVDPG
jgi:hypothetical protein